MKKEDLIIKWLDNNLDESELKAFKELDASSDFIKIDTAIKDIEIPDFDVDASLSRLKSGLLQKKSNSPWKKYISSIAAVLVAALCVYFAVFNTTETTYLAKNGEKLEFLLPDTSEVVLNAGSSIAFKESSWDDHRELSLQGEAYFKVAKGKIFTVETEQGSISVKGTQFSVKARQGVFEVICFEGMVEVSYKNESSKLIAGQLFSVYNNKIEQHGTQLIEPTWLKTKSSFTSIPFHQVVKELERQYNVKISGEGINEKTLFTGSFTHENLETALQAITIPLNLSFDIKGTEVVLKSN